MVRIIRRYRVLFLLLLLCIIAYFIIQIYIFGVSGLIPVNRFLASTGPIFHNHEISVDMNRNIRILYNDDKWENEVSVALMEAGELVWATMLVGGSVPILCVLSQGINYDFFVVQLFVRAHENAEQGHLTIAPKSDKKRYLTVDAAAFGGMGFRGPEDLLHICSITLNWSGSIQSIKYNSLFDIMDKCYMRFAINKGALPNGKDDVSITAHYKDDPRSDWNISFSGIDPKNIISIHPIDCNRIIIVSIFSFSLSLSGETLFRRHHGFNEASIAIIEVDKTGRERWYGIVGPVSFDYGSTAIAESGKNEDGSIYLIATYTSPMTYWHGNREENLNLRSLNILNRLVSGINHSQCLLIIDSDGYVQFAGTLSDGYLWYPITMQAMPNQSFGIYARVGSNLRILHNDDIQEITDKYIFAIIDDSNI